ERTEPAARRATRRRWDGLRPAPLRTPAVRPAAVRPALRPAAALRATAVRPAAVRATAVRPAVRPAAPARPTLRAAASWWRGRRGEPADPAGLRRGAAAAGHPPGRAACVPGLARDHRGERPRHDHLDARRRRLLLRGRDRLRAPRRRDRGVPRPALPRPGAVGAHRPHRPHRARDALRPPVARRLLRAPGVRAVRRARDPRHQPRVPRGRHPGADQRVARLVERLVRAAPVL
ncbi:MAG: hypothetical protein AVDCRST_MAG54-2923, partial [uncultured Actinomycetospora sp.]